MSRKPTPLFFSLFLFLVSVPGGLWAQPSDGLPNLLLIFVDDLGYGDLGCYGNEKIKTPHIDRLAEEGQRWTNFYASGPVCVPSRRGLMSGRHPGLIGDLPFVQIRDQLLPSMLKRRGYATAILGKWHLAGYPEDFTQSPMHPLECGFDYHFGTPGSNDVPAPVGKRQTRDVFDAADKFTFQVPLIRGREVVEFPVNQELFTQRYTEEAIAWISKDRDSPFFLYMAHNMPHVPIFASAAFQGRSDGGAYGDVIEEIDWSVGQVVEALEREKLRENTLIIFTSDNGPWIMFGPHGGTAGPLRGEKGTSWEGGYRVPAIFNWPGAIAPKEVHGIGANLDLYATFASLVGGEEPSDAPGYWSMNLSETLLRGSPSPRKEWLYLGVSQAYRSGSYKIHFSSKDRGSDPDTRQREPLVQYSPPLLFDLSRDMGERNDIGPSHPEIVQRLTREFKKYTSVRE